MTKPEEWRVHIGAHKTATTHLQAVLEHLAPDHNGSEVKLLPLSVTRPACRASCRRGTGLARMRNTIQMKITHAPRLQREASGTRLAVVSEEDILGWTQNQLGEQLYPDLDGLDLLPLLAGRADLKIYVSIRAYHTLLPSAFFEIYKFFPDAPSRFETGIAEILKGASGWVTLLDRVQERLPKAQILFWRQEDYSRDPLPIVRRFTGLELESLPDVPRPRSTMSPNADALEAVAALDPALENQARHRAVQEIYRKHPKGAGRTAQLLSDAQTRELIAIYEQDLEALNARFENIGNAAGSPEGVRTAV